jgi:hypothetical protein
MVQTTKEITTMAMIKKTHNGKEYEIHTYQDFNGAMVCGNIYEVVHPTWKIFRTAYCKHFCFWISDFPTVREGVDFCFDDYIADILLTQENYRKYEEFEKGG